MPATQWLSVVHVVLKYLLQLRLVLLAAELLGLLAVALIFEVEVTWLMALGVLGTMTLYSAWSWRRWRGIQDVPAAEFVRQTVADLVALTVLLYDTGGPVNPFISLFILPIVFAAATLPLRATTAIAMLAAGSYTLLMFFYRPVVTHSHQLHGHDLHLWGMWYGFLVSAVCVAMFVARIARSLRQRDFALAAAREQMLEAERAIALGTLAAGTAHELGTPLASIAILAADLELDLATHPAQRAAVATLRTQVARCKDILTGMTADAGALPAQSGGPVAVDKFLNDLLLDWQQARSAITVEIQMEAAAAPVLIVADRTLRQALLNILNNAADACQQRVAVKSRWDREELQLEIIDDGPGVLEGLREKLGREVVSSKGEQGLGLGLYLAHSVLRRLGGSVVFGPPGTVGTMVEIRLPLSSLLA